MQEEQGISNMRKINKGEIYSFEMKNWNDFFSGKVISVGKYWLSIYDINNDFIIDGVKLIFIPNIKFVFQGKEEIFLTKMLEIKAPFYKDYDFPIILNSKIDVLNMLSKKCRVLFVECENEEIGYLGTILDVSNSDFKLRQLGRRGKWVENKTIQISDVRCISSDSEYSKSLLLFNQIVWGEK